MRVLAAAALAAVALAAPPRAAAEVEVHYRNGRVDLRATAAPLSEVLDRLGRATAMKVVNEGQTPAVQLTLTLEGRTPTEAVLGVLEGLGLNYALSLDASGSRIETLILAGAAGNKPAPATFRSSTPTNRFIPRASPVIPDEPDMAEEAPPVEDDEEANGAEGEVDEPLDEGAQQDPAQPPGAPPGPRGSVLQAPAEPLFPSSPFAPRAPVFAPAPEPPPTDQTPKPPDRK
jgi:hypothetical protein